MKITTLTGPELIKLTGITGASPAKWYAPRNNQPDALEYWPPQWGTVAGLKASTYILATEPEKFSVTPVLGFISLQLDPGHLSHVWFKTISIRPSYKRKGIATALVGEFALWIAPQDVHVGITEYTEEGLQYLQPVLEQTLSGLGKKWFFER